MKPGREGGRQLVDMVYLKMELQEAEMKIEKIDHDFQCAGWKTILRLIWGVNTASLVRRMKSAHLYVLQMTCLEM